MAALLPNLKIRLDLATAGLSKGVGQAKQQLLGLAKSAGTADSKISKLKSRMSGVWRITGGIVLFNIIRKITRALEGLIGTVVDFEKEMYNVNSVAQMSDEQLKVFTNQVLDMVLDPRIKDGPVNIAKGLYEIVSAGYSASDALILVKTAAIAATAGMTTTAVASDVLISTLGAYNLGVDHAGEVSDKLFQIVNISKYTFEDLASSLASVTPIAAKLGIPIEDVGAAMATMASQGVSADTATVQLNAVLTGLLKPTDAMTEALHASGYASGEALIQAVGLGGALEWANKQIGGSAEKATELFGDVRALRGILELTTDDGKKYAEMLGLMGHAQDGTGATAKALDQQMKSNAFQMDVLKKNLQVLAIMGFGFISPYLNKALLGINKFFVGMLTYFRHFKALGLTNWVSFKLALFKIIEDTFGHKIAIKVYKFMNKLEEYFHTLKGMVESAWKKIKPVLGFLVDHLNILIPALVGAVIGMKAFAVVMGIVNAVLFITNIELSPLTITLIAFAAIGALVAVAWYNNWFGIQQWTAKSVKFIGKWLGKLWDWVQPGIHVIKLLGSYWKKVMTGDLEPGQLKNIPGWIQPIALIIGRVVKMVRVFIIAWHKAGALAAFRTLPAQIRALGRAFDKILTNMGLVNLANMVNRVFHDVADTVGYAVEFVNDLVHGRWKQAWMDLSQLMWAGMKTTLHLVLLMPASILDAFNAIPWGTVGDYLLKGLFGLASLMETGEKWLWHAGGRLIKAMIKGIKNYWKDTLQPWISDLPRKMYVFLASNESYNLFFQVGNFVISALGSGITSAWNWLMGWVPGLLGRIVDYFAGYYNSFYNIGHYIISGLAAGIGNAWNWMVGWLEDKWNSLPGFLKKLWKIASPSKVFAAIGKEIPHGLAVGVDSGMKHVMKAMQGMNVAVNGGTPQGSTPVAGPSRVGSSAVVKGARGGLTVHIGSIVSNATDPAVVAQEVSRVIMGEVARVQAGAAA